MEILVGLAVVLFILVGGYFAISATGKAVGHPDPATLSDEALQQRRTTELNWLVKYSDLPFSKKQDAKLKAMHDEKDAYLRLLTAEWNRRKIGGKI